MLLSNNRGLFLAFVLYPHQVNNSKANHMDETMTNIRCNLYFAQTTFTTGGIHDRLRFRNDAP